MININVKNRITNGDVRQNKMKHNQVLTSSSNRAHSIVGIRVGIRNGIREGGEERVRVIPVFTTLNTAIFHMNSVSCDPSRVRKSHYDDTIPCYVKNVLHVKVLDMTKYPLFLVEELYTDVSSGQIVYSGTLDTSDPHFLL
jgi:hypothetical protein